MSKAKTQHTPLPSLTEIEQFIAAEVDLGLVPQQIRKDLEEKLTSALPSAHFSPAVISELAKTLYSASIKTLEARQLAESIKKSAASEAPQLSWEEHLALLRSYLEPLCELLLKDTTQNPALRVPTLRLLSAFVATALTGYHASGWIRYDRKTLFNLASLNSLPVASQTEVTTKVHKYYQLGMRVIGSNQPIACFKFQWFINPTPEDLQHFELFTTEQIYSEILQILELTPSPVTL